MQTIRNLVVAFGGAIILEAAAPASALTYTSFAPSQWGEADSAIGIDDFLIEDFENITLGNGLRIGWQTPAGNVAPSSTMPNRFAPQFDDFGDAFEGANGGAWSGSMGVINTRTNNSFNYGSRIDFGSIVIEFAAPVSSVGFSLQQANLPVTLAVNGADKGNLATLAGVTLGGGRQGYVLINASAGETISSITLKNTGGPSSSYDDVFMIDRLAFLPVSAPVPEPETYALILSGLGMIGFALVRQKRRA